ncbi:hypothetical protein Tco_1555956 [Tanacetum coccineum]
MDSVIPLRQKNTLAEYMILSELKMVHSFGLLVEENGVTRTKKYAKLSAAEKIQADFDMKATNIILQGLPADIYSLERECKLYDAFDKFTHIKGETLHNLLPELSKFVTDVKLVKDLHTTNFDQLHAYLEQHELYANEVRLLRERNQDPLAFVANQQMTPPHFNTYQSSYNNPQLQQQFSPSQFGSIHPNQHYSSTYPSQPQFNHLSVPSSYPYQSQMNHQTSSVPQIAYQSPQVTTQPMTEPPLMDSNFAVPVFSPGDDPIACLNKAMAFLTTIASSRGDKVKVILVLGIRVMLLAQGETMQADMQGLLNAKTVKQLAFPADPGVPDGQAVQTIIPNNVAFQTEDLDTYDSDCDDISNAQAVLMANISNYEINVILEWSRKMIDSQMDDMIRDKLALKEQVDSLKQSLSKQIKEKECLLQTFTIFKNESKEKEDKYMENEIDLEKKIKELDNILFKVGQSAQTLHMLTKPQAFYHNIHKQALGYQNPFYLKKAQWIKPTLYDGIVMSDKHVAMPMIDDEETLILEEKSR